MLLEFKVAKFTFVAQRLLSWTNRTRIVVAHVDKRLCVLTAKQESRPWYSASQ